MNMKMTKLMKNSRFAVFLLLAAVVLLSVSVKAKAEVRQIYDNASLFSEEEVMLLTDAADGLEEQTGWDAMVKDTAVFYEDGIADGLTIYNEDGGTYTHYQDVQKRAVTFGEMILAVVAGAAACVIFCLVIIGKYRLKFGRYHYNVRENAVVDLTKREDHLVNRFVTRRKIPKNPPPSKGGGRPGTIHTGAGGRSFGGGGRKF